MGDDDLVAWLDRLERDHDALVFVGDGESTPWTRRCVRQADDLLVVVDAAEDPAPGALEAALAGAEERYAAKRHLVLLQARGVSEARGTAAWLDAREVAAHHHVRAGRTGDGEGVDAGDVGRLARRLSERAVVVAFSGASSRAPGHLGVARALRERGVPIDRVSGSSSGAGVASLVAAGFAEDEALERAVRIIEDGAPSVRQMQPPFTALTSGRAPDRALQAAFGERLLEDQLIPAALVAVDLRRHRLVTLSRGPIWEAVRASGSLPMMWPPVWRGEELLVDGGVMSYLPVDVIGDEAEGGLLIASNLDPSAGHGLPFEGALRYGTRISGWRQLGRRLVRSKKARAPGMVDILFHTMALTSFREQEGLAALGERPNACVLTPPLGSFGLFEVGAEAGRRLEEAAYTHAMEALGPAVETWRARRVGREA